MKYIETTFTKYHTNVTGSTTMNSHPDFIVLDGNKIDCSYDVRNECIITQSNEGEIKVNYYKLSDDISFKFLSDWDHTTNNGNKIRWRLPKGSRLIWVDTNGQIEKEETV